MKTGLFVNKFGTKIYYLNDLYHREDGPAIEWGDGNKEWYCHGELHRTDGPAIEWRDGDKCWYYHGEKVNCNSQKEFKQLIRLRAFL
jgi:hypothetical protein